MLILKIILLNYPNKQIYIMIDGMYGSLSSLYYDLDAAHGAQKELPFYRIYAEKAQGPILEPMCGTGNFLIPFTQEGFDIEGFDASAHMLERLQEKAEKQKATIRAWHWLLEKFSVKSKYSLAFIPNCSFNLIQDLDTIKICLENIYNSLAHDGLFVCEILTTAVQKSVHHGRTTKSRTLLDGTILKVETESIPCNGPYLTTKHTYTLSQGNQIVRTETEQYTLRLYEPSEFEMLIKSAGFSAVTQTQLYQYGEQPNPHDDIIVYACKK